MRVSLDAYLAGLEIGETAGRVPVRPVGESVRKWVVLLANRRAPGHRAITEELRVRPRPRMVSSMAGSIPRVLLVEDDEDIRDAMGDVITREGFEAIAVTHGLEALRYLTTCDELPDLILLDLMMPVMDGWEFLRRRDERLKQVPVVVITAGPTSGLPEGVRALRKPISMELLLGELRPCWKTNDVST